VNLNTAGLEELMTLTGIGQTRAEAILAYREEEGAFRSPEDIMNVEGIKEGIYEKLKDEITV
jgi:competence protein ComEA